MTDTVIDSPSDTDRRLAAVLAYSRAVAQARRAYRAALDTHAVVGPDGATAARAYTHARAAALDAYRQAMT